MKKILVHLIFVLFTGSAAMAQTASSQLEIILENNDQKEQQTKQQLLRLLSTYDVSDWIFTRKININGNRRTIPHSHPVLTLSTRHLKDDELLLATFIHEQIHWYIEGKKESKEAYKELKTMFPKVPVGFPEGSSDEVSTYYHIQVCFLEYLAVESLLGALKAKQVMEFWKTDHYTWVYKTILERKMDIYAVMRKHNLVPTAGKTS